jgi:flavin-dependent dehydrogenase
VIGADQATDVFIVGGGPAGLAAAIAARKKGFSVTVADGAAPPVEKPCGEGMMPETLTALADLGVNFTEDEGFRFRGISFFQDAASVSADFPNGRGLGLRRPMLHQRLLLRATACGVKILWNTPVCGIDGQLVRLSRTTIRANWIIGADGMGSRVRRWTGLDSSARNQRRYATRRHYRAKPWSDRVEIYWGNSTQAYVTPIAGDEICVVTMAQSSKGAAFESALCEMPELERKLRDAQPSGRERGAVTAMHSLRSVCRGNVALIGDASGGVDALTGEGLRLAFRQAFALADAMAAGKLSRYQRAHEEIARRPILMGNLMLWLSRHSRLRVRMVRAMQERPDVFSLLLATHVGAGTLARLFPAGARLGLRMLTVSDGRTVEL